MRSMAATATILFLVVFSGAAGQPREGDAPKGAEEIVVYSTLQPFNLDILMVEQASGPPKRLTQDQANDYNAVFSPDGRWIVFCSERNGSPDLYALDLGSDNKLIQLTSSAAMEDAPAFSPDGKKLAFVSDAHGNADIFVMPFAPTGPSAEKSAVNLTHLPGGDFNPAFSPNGETIAFCSDRHLHLGMPEAWGSSANQGGEVYLMNSEGSNVRRLTHADGWDGAPAWSRDALHIYFYSQRDTSTRIWRMNSDGSDPRPVTTADVDGVAPCVAPDGRVFFAQQSENGTRIVSIRDNDERSRVECEAVSDAAAPEIDARGRLIFHAEGPIENREVRPNGKPLLASGARSIVSIGGRRVLRQGVFPRFPSLAPDGREFVSGHNQSSFTEPLTVCDFRMGNPRKIETPEGLSWGTDWSPSGDRISFTLGSIFGDDRANVDIWAANSDGSDLVNLTKDCGVNDAFPHFAADGRIVFRSTRDGNKEIYLMGRDGTNVRRLTHDPAIDTMPTISPDGTLVVFSSTRDAAPGFFGEYDLYFVQITPEGRPGIGIPFWTPGVSVIAPAPGPDMHPRFSPDGQWVVFTSARGGYNDEPPINNAGPQPYGEIWAARISPGYSNGLMRLTHNKWEDGPCDWSRLAPADE